MEDKFFPKIKDFIMIDNPYKSICITFIQRMLTQLDRDIDSPSFGCFDRMYWHYKVMDFPNIIHQQAVLPLTKFYLYDFDGNVFFNNERVKTWCIGAINFWKSHIHSDGTGDEYWPNEHGYPPTVFPLYCVSEAYRQLKEKCIFFDNNLERTLLKSAHFICIYKEKEALNQEVASLAALYSVSSVINDDKIKKAIELKKAFIKKMKTAEGWLPEYGGCDLGYSSVTLDYLALCWSLSKDDFFLSLIGELVLFLSYFVHPDGSFGGEYGSRNTEYFMPNGLEVSGSKFPIAYKILDRIFKSNNNLYYFYNGIDDRYLGDYITRSFVDAFYNFEKRKNNSQDKYAQIKLPYEREKITYFSKAGLATVSYKKYYLVIGLVKGGTIKLFKKDKNRLLFSDCGYRIKLKSNQFAVSAWTRKDTTFDYYPGNKEFNCKGSFNKKDFLVSKPFKHIMLRLFAYISGNKIINLLKNIFIISDKKTNIIFSRKIIFDENQIKIMDVIISPKEVKLMSSSGRYSLRYVPSSRFFNPNELEGINKIHYFHNFRNIEIRRIIDIEEETYRISKKINF